MGQEWVQSLATWWTDIASYRMHIKFSPFEKQSNNQRITKEHQCSRERGEI
jgi:hypothetical protein